MPNPDGTPTAQEIDVRRRATFTQINDHNQLLVSKEFVDFVDRDAADVRRALKNMRSLILMEREVGRYEHIDQRARSLYMLSKQISHLFFRAAYTLVDPMNLCSNYTRVEERSIWRDLDFLRVCGDYGEHPRLRLTPKIVNDILDQDLPRLLQVVSAELGADEVLKTQSRQLFGGNSRNLPNIYKISNFHRTKFSLEKAVTLIDQVISTGFSFTNEKQRFAFCRLLTEIGECFTKKNLTDTAQLFFSDASLRDLSGLRNNLTHFEGYMYKNDGILGVLRSPQVQEMFERIKQEDLPRLREITMDALTITLNYPQNISDNGFERRVEEHFDFINQRTLQKVELKLKAIKNPNNNQNLFSSLEIRELVNSLRNRGGIINNEQQALAFRGEIEAKIRNIDPIFIGQLKRNLSDIQKLANNGVSSLRSDQPFVNISALKEYLNLRLNEPNSVSEVVTNDRRIDLIRTLEYMLPTNFVFRELGDPFRENIVEIHNQQGIKYIELESLGLTPDRLRRYQIYKLIGKDVDANQIIEDHISRNPLNQARVDSDTRKHNSFIAMREGIRNDSFTSKSIEFLLAGIQEVIGNDINLSVDTDRQLRAFRNSIAHQDPLLMRIDSQEFNLRYASIYIKEVMPQLQALHQANNVIPGVIIM